MMCRNKKVVIGAGVVVGGLLLFNPGWAVAALPVVLLAVCPLSMVFMMRGMGGQGANGAACGTSGTAAKSATATGTDVDKQIADLQEEVRILRAASTQQQAAQTPPPAMDFSKPDQPGPRP
ncbi:DUF2933 domain-containing protein [Streptomyces sp. NPDC044948]|uniref:DUF2933 domain-containing protein n=1 Tax=Streptomyces sp. NPDC044948 TaxID=3157092 RepID=UPI0033C25803